MKNLKPNLLWLFIFLNCYTTYATNYSVSNLSGDKTDVNSLPWAIEQANTNSGFDQINIDVTGTIFTNEEMVINDDLTIFGSGKELLTIDGGGGHRIFRIENTSSFSVFITDLTVQNGKVFLGTIAKGAGFLNVNATLTLENVDILSNEVSAPGPTSVAATSAFGGGIYNDGGTVALDNVVMSGNSANAFGGFSINAKAKAGAIYTNGTFQIYNSHIEGNTCSNVGLTPLAETAGIHNDGNMRIINTIIENNVSTATSNNIAKAHAGGIKNTGTFKIFNSVIFNNKAIAGNNFLSKAFGGGIYNVGMMDILNTLIYGNEVEGGASFDSNANNEVLGAGIFNASEELTIINVTIVNNEAIWNDGGIDILTKGGGVYSLSSSFSMTNSVVWGNTADEFSQLSDNASVNHSTVQGVGIYPGNNNLNVDPEFLDIADPNGSDNIFGTNDDGLQISFCSEVRNVGDNQVYLDAIAASVGMLPELNEDLKKTDRITSSIIDLGAYEEVGIQASCISETTIEIQDLGPGIAFFIPQSVVLNSSGGCGQLGYGIQGMPTTDFTCSQLGINNITVVIGDGIGNGFETCEVQVEVIDPNGICDCTTTSNLALGKSTSQSGTQVNATSDRAVDGNTDGNFWQSYSVTNTEWVTNPWWEVDLGEVVQIENINIWNRTDALFELLKNYHVFVSDVPFSSTNLTTTINQTGVGDFFQTDQAGTPSDLSINRTGRYVRVQIEGSAFLALAEVEVFGCSTGGGCPPFGTSCDDGNPNTINDIQDGNCNCSGTPINTGGCDASSLVNVALNKSGTQSGTQAGGVANRALDGNTDGDFYASQSTTQTEWLNNAWWEVDLGEVAEIDHLKIWNRTDCCNSFLENYYILVSDVPFVSTNLNTTLNQTGVSAYFQTDQAGSPTTQEITRTGRYVRIQLSGQGFISLAEVEIMGCTSVCPSTTNLALNKPAEQISTEVANGIYADASKAVDGSLANLGVFDCATTHFNNDPYWQVDLESDYYIEEIKLLPIAYAQALSQTIPTDQNVYLLVSDTPFSGNNLADAIAQSSFQYFHPGFLDDPTVVSINTSGRYVRVQMDLDDSKLSLAEVQVFGCAPNDLCSSFGGDADQDGVCSVEDCDDQNPNVPAPVDTPCDDGNPATTGDVIQEDGCTCAGEIGNEPGCLPYDPNNFVSFTNNVITQSSILSVGGITGNPEKVKDGNTNGIFFTNDPSASSVAATQYEQDPWLSIHLNQGSGLVFKTFKVYNRTDGVDKTKNFWLFISQVPIDEILSVTGEDWTVLKDHPLVYASFHSGEAGSPSIIDVTDIDPFQREVRIQMEGAGHLTLAEIEYNACISDLPITMASADFLNFTAKKEGVKAELQWLMRQDTSVDFYEVEVSTDLLNFNKIGEVDADEMDTPRSYHVTDWKPNFGLNYYRIKVIDKNGDFYFSDLRRLNFDIDFSEVKIFPNPASEQLNVLLHDFSGKSGKIEIVNNLGQVLERKDYLSFPSIPLQIDVSNYQGGIYYISFQVDGYRKFTKKFVIGRM